MSGRRFIDTNVIVYAHVSEDEQKHKLAIDLLQDTLAGSRLWISTQILSEFYSAMSKNKFEHEQITELISEIMQSMNVVSVTSETIETALMLKGKYHFSYWDSLMLSAALISNCEVVYSEDMQHNQTIEGRLRILNPFGSCEND